MDKYNANSTTKKQTELFSLMILEGLDM